MVYSKSLAARVRQSLSGRAHLVEKRMFGSLCFLLRGNLLVGIWGYSLIARVGADAAATALREPHVRAFDATGRPMKGWVVVDPDGIDSDQQLRLWIERAEAFVGTLPTK